MNGVFEFVNEHGVNIVTLALVLLSLFKDQLKDLLKRRIDLSARRLEQGADAEAKAWDRVFRNGTRANGYVERLLLQQEHHHANMRERDAHIERFVTVAVEAVRDAVAVMEATAKKQQRNDEQTVEVLAELNRILAGLHEQSAAVGVVLSLYLHDRQGVTYDELLAAIASAGDIRQKEEPT